MDNNYLGTEEDEYNGYYDEYGRWIVGYYDEFGQWVEGYYDEEGEWETTSITNPNEYQENDLYFQEPQQSPYEDTEYQYGYEYGEQDYYVEETEEISFIYKVVGTLKILLPVVITIVMITIGLRLYKEEPIFKLPTMVNGVEYEDENLKIVDKEFPISSTGNIVAVYNMIVKGEKSKEEIEEMLNLQFIFDLPGMEDGQEAIILISDSEMYSKTPTLGKVYVKKDTEIDRQIKDKDWTLKPTEEQAQIYKSFLKEENEVRTNGGVVREEYVISKVMESTEYTKEEIQETLNSLSNWID